MGDDGIGRLQDGLGGAVVLLQADHLGCRVLLFKAENILNGGAPKAVDALVVVAHHADVLIAAREERGEKILQVVGVLVLVDEHIAELALIVASHILKLLQKLHGAQNDIVKIQGIGLLEARFIEVIGRDSPLHAVVPRYGGSLGKFLRRLHLILGAADKVEEHPGREGLLVELHVSNNILHHPLGILGIIDGKAAGIAKAVDIPAENPAAGGVEGHCPDIRRVVSQHFGQAILQFIGSLVGKRDGDDAPGLGRFQRAQRLRPGLILFPGTSEIILQKCHVLRGDVLGDLLGIRGAAKGHQIGDAVDEHRGLAAARAGQKKQRPLRGEHGAPLHVIQGSKPPGNDPAAGSEKPLLVFLIHGFTCSNCDSPILVYFSPFVT